MHESERAAIGIKGLSEVPSSWSELMNAVFTAAAWRRGASVHLNFKRPSTTPMTEFLPLGDVLLRLLDDAPDEEDDDASRAIMLIDNCLVDISTSRTHSTWFRIAGPSEEAVKALRGRLEKLCKAPRLTTARTVRINFMSWGGHAVDNNGRDIEAPRWRAISGNYVGSTAAAFAAQMARPNARDGRVLVVHGPPGTGKTYALRALAREWASRWKAEVSYLIDPEAFFAMPNYMKQAVVGERPRTYTELRDAQRKRNLGIKRGPRVIIIEDADEMISVDAKERSGQALSRLLNLTDGFLGQGSDLFLILTTNEPIGKFHPALTRPGRCRAVIEVPLFNGHEATAWLGAHGWRGASVAPHVSMSLAALYGMLRKPESVAAAPKAVGFGR